MNNSKNLQNTKTLKVQYKKKKYEALDEAQFLEESLKFFKNIAAKFSKDEYSNGLQQI
jgi:hypothetical protein